MLSFCPQNEKERQENGFLHESAEKQEGICTLYGGDIRHIGCTVFLMSIFLTVIGTWIGTRHISMDPIRMFFYKWPRNAAISFFVEACIAQPIARLVMFKIHGGAAPKSEAA